MKQKSDAHGFGRLSTRLGNMPLYARRLAAVVFALFGVLDFFVGVSKLFLMFLAILLIIGGRPAWPPADMAIGWEVVYALSLVPSSVLCFYASRRWWNGEYRKAILTSMIFVVVHTLQNMVKFPHL